MNIKVFVGVAVALAVIVVAPWFLPMKRRRDPLDGIGADGAWSGNPDSRPYHHDSDHGEFDGGHGGSDGGGH